MMRRQAINELVGEARNFGADSVARSAAGLRGREAEPAFVDEYLRCVRALGPHAKRWSDNEFGKLGNLRAMGKRAGGNYPPPGITSREYRPGAGIAGYVPLGAVWEAYAPTMGSYRLAETVGLNAYSEARLYRRWVRGEVAR